MNQAKQKPENMLVNLLFNIAFPVLILTKLSSPDRLGPIWGLVLALAFPITYGVVDLLKNKKWNFFSLLGLISVLLTGGLALLKLDGFWFAVKEAAIPGLIGIGVLISIRTRYPLTKMIVLNPAVMDVQKIESTLEAKGEIPKFEKLLGHVNYMVASSFGLSAILNFGLARWILKSPAGSVEFNAELGRMTALSFPVIMIPCMVILSLALWYLIVGIKKLTGLDLQDIMKQQ